LHARIPATIACLQQIQQGQTVQLRQSDFTPLMEQYGHGILEAELAVQDQRLTPLGFSALRGNTVSSSPMIDVSQATVQICRCSPSVLHVLTTRHAVL